MSRVPIHDHTNIHQGGKIRGKSITGVGSIGDVGGSTGGDTTTSGDFLSKTGGGKGTLSSLGTLGATETINVAAANYFYGTLDSDCDIDFTGWTTSTDSVITLELLEDGTGGWEPTFSTVTWLTGTAPEHDTTADSTTLYVFMSRDGGSTILGGQLGGGVTAADIETAGHWEVLMDGGSPPAALESGSGTDWLYVWVPA